MIVATTSRVLSALPSYLEMFSESTANADGFGSTESMVSVDGATSSTTYSATQSFSSEASATDGFTETIEVGSAAGTTYQDAISYSFTNAIGGTTDVIDSDTDAHGTFGTGSSFSYSTGIFSVSNSISLSGYSSVYNTTANVGTTTSYFTVTGTGSLASVTTSSSACTVVSNYSTDGEVVLPYDLTSSIFSGITTTTDVLAEIGTMVSADTDWLWQITNYDLGPHVISDFCASFEATTYWPVATSLTRAYAIYPDDSATSSTTSIAGNTSSFSYQYLYPVDTSLLTAETVLTSGESLSRDTYSTSYSVWSTSSDSSLFGVNDQTITAISTAEISITTMIPFTYEVTALYPVGISNSSSTVLNSITTSLGTTTSFSILPAYLPSFGDEGEVGGVTLQATDISYVNVSIIPFGGAGGEISPIGAYGAFIAPTALHSTAHPLTFAANLSLGGTQVPYPSFASAAINGAVPFPSATSTTGTDGISWLFSWTSDTVKFTQQSSYSGGTHTLLTKTISSGAFSTDSDASTYLTQRGITFGGFPAIASEAATVFYPPRAVLGTINSFGGGSTTYKTLETNTSSAELSETVIVETTRQAYYVYTYLASSAQDASFSFFEMPRNPE